MTRDLTTNQNKIEKDAFANQPRSDRDACWWLARSRERPHASGRLPGRHLLGGHGGPGERGGTRQRRGHGKTSGAKRPACSPDSAPCEQTSTARTERRWSESRNLANRICDNSRDSERFPIWSNRSLLVMAVRHDNLIGSCSDPVVRHDIFVAVTPRPSGHARIEHHAWPRSCCVQCDHLAGPKRR